MRIKKKPVLISAPTQIKLGFPVGSQYRFPILKLLELIISLLALLVKENRSAAIIPLLPRRGVIIFKEGIVYAQHQNIQKCPCNGRIKRRLLLQKFVLTVSQPERARKRNG